MSASGSASSRSRTGLRKQTSLVESPGDPAPAKLNRSMTLDKRSGVKNREVTSPLKRFTRAKECISKAFELIKERLVDSRQLFEESREQGQRERVESLQEQVRGIQEVLRRDHMKVAFFGRTSNGKSSVINALLHHKVLPAGIGHTTSCFCSVIGGDAEEGYMTRPGSSDRHNVQSVQQLAHSLHRERLSSSSLVQVVWPKSKCSLLKDDVEFVDSPGVDVDPNMDEWINQHCLDADVFVLVSNAESTLMTAEKSFFHRVSERLSKPNIFILNNRWDASANETEMMEEVRTQHLETDINFLTNELKVMDEATARNRVFFVSAKEVLHLRSQSDKSKDPGLGLADGYNSRLMEFERFESRFKECVSDTAIRTKFEHHHRQGVELLAQLEAVLKAQEEEILKKRGLMDQEVAESREREVLMEHQAQQALLQCQGTVEGVGREVEGKVTRRMLEKLRGLRSYVDTCVVTFDPNHVDAYKKQQCQLLDANFVPALVSEGSAALSAVHTHYQTSIVEAYKDVLHLSENDTQGFVHMHRPPEGGRLPPCQDLCQDFKEDLEFHFSFGLGSLLKFVNVDALSSVEPSRVLSWIPGDKMLSLLAISVLLTGLVIPRGVFLRVAMPSLAAYGGLYAYERLMWTDRTKQRMLKDQLMKHLKEKLSSRVEAIGDSYSAVVSGNAQSLVGVLRGRREGVREEEEERKRQLMQESHRLLALLNTTRTIRNSVQLVQEDMRNFEEDFLQHM